MPIDTRPTYDDYCLLPNNGKRYEIIEGELFVSRSASLLHQSFLANLLYYVTDFVKKHALGEVYPAPFDVVFSQYDVVEPDILYVSKARASVMTEKNVQGAPDLVVEVLSESTAKIDRTTKLKLYARYGVAEYWVVDPETCSVEIYRLIHGGYDLAAQLDSSQSLTSPLSPVPMLFAPAFQTRRVGQPFRAITPQVRGGRRTVAGSAWTASGWKGASTST
jgi:Uma2 family endonuclease